MATDSTISKEEELLARKSPAKKRNKLKESFGLLCICAKENTAVTNWGLSYLEQDYLFNPQRLSMNKADQKLAETTPTPIFLNNGEAFSLMTSNFAGATYGEGARSIPKGHYDTFLDRRSFHYTAMREFMEETKLTHKNFPYYMKIIAENESVGGVDREMKQRTERHRGGVDESVGVGVKVKEEQEQDEPPQSQIQPKIPPSLSCDDFGDMDVDPNMLFDPENQLTDCIYGLDHNPYKTRYFVYVVENENCLDAISRRDMNNILMLNPKYKGKKGRRCRKRNYFSHLLDSHKKVECVPIDELPAILYRDKFKVTEKICMEKLYSIIKKYREKNKYKIACTDTGTSRRERGEKEKEEEAIAAAAVAAAAAAAASSAIISERVTLPDKVK